MPNITLHEREALPLHGCIIAWNDAERRFNFFNGEFTYDTAAGGYKAPPPWFEKQVFPGKGWYKLMQENRQEGVSKEFEFDDKDVIMVCIVETQVEIDAFKFGSQLGWIASALAHKVANATKEE